MGRGVVMKRTNVFESCDRTSFLVVCFQFLGRLFLVLPYYTYFKHILLPIFTYTVHKYNKQVSKATIGLSHKFINLVTALPNRSVKLTCLTIRQRKKWQFIKLQIKDYNLFSQAYIGKKVRKKKQSDEKGKDQKYEV